MLFLLIQLHAGLSANSFGTSTPWTEYVKMLPENVPVPTLWVEEERDMLVGTSLEVRIIFYWSSVHLPNIIMASSTKVFFAICK
jgi:hypothetical protein